MKIQFQHGFFVIIETEESQQQSIATFSSSSAMSSSRIMKLGQTSCVFVSLERSNASGVLHGKNQHVSSGGFLEGAY